MTDVTGKEPTTHTRAIVQAYSQGSKGMTLDEHVDAIANIGANIALAMYQNRVASGYEPDKALKLAKNTIEGICQAMKDVLDTHVEMSEQAHADAANAVIDKVNASGGGGDASIVDMSGKPLARQQAERMAAAVMKSGLKQ